MDDARHTKTMSSNAVAGTSSLDSYPFSKIHQNSECRILLKTFKGTAKEPKEPVRADWYRNPGQCTVYKGLVSQCWGTHGD
jgi:hypothetical protein